MTLQAQTTKELDGYPTIFSDYDAYYNKWILEDDYFKTTSWFKKGWSTFYRFADNTYQKASMYISEGDSIVAGIAYARVLIDQKTLLYRQEGDKVFARTDGEDKLLIDYGLNVGDTFVNPQGERFTVTSTDTATCQGSIYGSYKYWRYQRIFFKGKTVPRILHLQSEDGTQEDEWVEGLGSAYWGILPPYMAESQGVYTTRPTRSHVITASSPYIIEEEGYISASYDLNEEDYKRISFDPKDIEYGKNYPWTYTFIGDTLHITGVMDLNCLPTYAECTIKGNDIDVLIYQVSGGLLDPDCLVERYVDIRFTGFKPGTYEVGVSGEKRQEVVCPGKQKESYIPFVEKWKQWHVLGFCMGPYKSVADYFFREDEEVSIGEHTYLPLYTGDKGVFYGVDNENKQLQGLFREEDRRVYLYDTAAEHEYCVYDFTLEVGDTFDIGWGNEADRCVVTNVGEMNIRGLKLKTITFSSISPAMGGSELLHDNHTWVEGIGDLSGPCAGWIPNMYSSSWSHCVAYMVSYNNYRCFPFSFSDFWGSSNWVIGHDLIPGEALTWKEYEEKIPGEALTWKEYEEKYQGEPLLDYEITGGRLHVKGYMWLQRCEAYYIYCKLSPTEEHWKTYKITLQDEVMGEETDCISTPHAVDLYFDIPFLQYDNNCNFVYEDQDGEHFVVNRDKYQPFVEEGKTWKVGLFWGSDKASEVEIYRMEGDTLVGDIACKRWIRQTMNYENRRTEYIGAVYEQGRRVYEFLPGRSEAVLLYDFATPVGEWVDVYDANLDSMVKCYIEKRDTVSTDGYLLRRTTVWSHPNDDTDVIYKTIWTEGIGYNQRPNYNTDSENPGDYHYLIACTTGTDVPLYKSPVLFEDISEYWMLQDRGEMGDGEARKEQIDFTHVVKTRPKAPACYANGVSLLWGEYDDSELSIAFGGMSGRYAISLQNDDEPQARYAATHETQNLQAIDINLTDYPEGRYTIAVENDEESYTAHFVLPLDGNGIVEMRLGDNEKTSSVAVYDLLGRRIPMPRKGVYLRGRQKIVK